MSTSEADRAYAMEMLERTGAIVTGGHFVYKSGRHGSAYVNKDALYRHPDIVSELTALMLTPVTEDMHRSDVPPPSVVVGPATGGIILSTLAASCLAAHHGWEVQSVYAEKERIPIPDPDLEGRKVSYETGRFVLGRGYAEAVRGKSVLIVEDILTTGSSVKEVIEAVQRAGGHVSYVAALCNRGGVTAQDIGARQLDTLIEVPLKSFPAERCPLCEAGVPINTTLGKGREFLASQGA